MICCGDLVTSPEDSPLNTRSHLLPTECPLSFLLLLFVCSFVFLFKSVPEAQGNSQVRGRIGAVAAAFTTAMATPDQSHICNLHWVLDPLNEAKD